MITSITVDGFKSLSDFYMVLNPGLNILVGPNGSGKTNVISFFEFLAALIDKDPSEATNCLGGAGAVFRRVNDTHQPTIFAKVTGCYPIDEDSYRIRGVKSKKNSKKFSLYEYTFKILFSNELESVVFSSQHLRYKHVNRFIAAESGETETTWDFEIETRLEVNMSVTTKVKSLKGEVIDYFPFFHQGKEEKMAKEAEGFLSRMNSAYTSLPSLLMRFTPVLHSLNEDLAGGQTYNIIPSKVKMLEESAKPPGISSDGSGLSATLYSLKKRSVSSNEPLWTIYSATRNPLKRPSLETLKSYFQLANSSIEDIEVNSEADPENRARS